MPRPRAYTKQQVQDVAARLRRGDRQADVVRATGVNAATVGDIAQGRGTYAAEAGKVKLRAAAEVARGRVEVAKRYPGSIPYHPASRGRNPYRPTDSVDPTLHPGADTRVLRYRGFGPEDGGRSVGIANRDPDFYVSSSPYTTAPRARRGRR